MKITTADGKVAEGLEQGRFEPIAVIGLGAIMPDAKDVNQFWQNIKAGKVSIKDVKSERWPGKIEDFWNISLKKNIDILKEMSKKKKDSQLIIGFALETENEKKNAIKKLLNKNLDLIVLNSTRDNESTFGFNTNKISIIEKDLKITDFDLKEKSEVAKDIVSFILKKIKK